MLYVVYTCSLSMHQLYHIVVHPECWWHCGQDNSIQPVVQAKHPIWILEKFAKTASPSTFHKALRMLHIRHATIGNTPQACCARCIRCLERWAQVNGRLASTNCFSPLCLLRNNLSAGGRRFIKYSTVDWGLFSLDGARGVESEGLRSGCKKASNKFRHLQRSSNLHRRRQIHLQIVDRLLHPHYFSRIFFGASLDTHFWCRLHRRPVDWNFLLENPKSRLPIARRRLNNWDGMFFFSDRGSCFSNQNYYLPPMSQNLLKSLHALWIYLAPKNRDV